MRHRRGDTPLYAQIKAYLEEQIRQGRLRPGDRVPSEAELAHQFGVSRITSKHALFLLAQEGLIYRIPGKGSFVADRATRAFGGHMMLGVVLPFLRMQHELNLLRGAEAEANRQGLTLVLRQSSGSQEVEAAAVRDLREAGAAALIVWPVDGAHYNPALLQLSLEGFPTVLVDRCLEGVALPAVVSDNREGARLAAHYVAQAGHRHVAVVSPPGDWASSIRDRQLGFLMGLAEAGVRREPDLWLTDLKNDLAQDRVRIRTFLAAHPEVTALLAVNSGNGEAAFQAARDLGRSVPDDLSIVCFDQPDPASVEGIPFTHVAQQAEEIGKRAVQLAIQRIQGDPSSLRLEVVPVKLLHGRTCQPPAEAASG
ncbi:MAG TPA: GntR family transcriptional regulator [Symbiobacteriaceae bacterium]